MQRSAVTLLIRSSMSGGTTKQWPGCIDPGRADGLSKCCELQSISGTTKNSQQHNFREY